MRRFVFQQSDFIFCLLTIISIMNTALIATLVYGLLAGLGGIWGYIKSKSKPSLISGCISGFLLIAAGIMQWQGYASGLLISQIIIALLLAVFAVRLVKTGKFMPAGIMLTTGVAALICTFA